MALSGGGTDPTKIVQLSVLTFAVAISQAFRTVPEVSQKRSCRPFTISDCGLPQYFALTDDRDRMYFARGEEGDQIGMLSEIDRAIFGRSYADEPDKLIAQLKGDEAIAEADTLLLTVPNQLAGRSPKRV